MRNRRDRSQSVPRNSCDSIYRSDIVHVVIEMAILGILENQEIHGYELKKRIAQLAGGPGGISFGSLYPALSRLEKSGHLRAVDPTRPRSASIFADPMTGAITGELAALRQRQALPTSAKTPEGRRSERRNRKVYAITERGRQRLGELVRTADPADERSFRLQVAFCREVSSSERIDLFERRRAHLVGELLQRRETGATDGDGTDTYLRSLRDHDRSTIDNDLDWVDELISMTRNELAQSEQGRAHTNRSATTKSR